MCFSFSFLVFSHTKPRHPYFKKNFILWHGVFVPLYFSRRITASIPWKGLCNPAVTGAFSCCWNYIRHPKISKTSKLQSKSSLLGFIKATKEEQADWSWAPPWFPSCGRVHWALPFPQEHKGSCLLQWEPCGSWFQRKIWFLLCQMHGYDKPGNVLSIFLLVRVWGVWRGHVWTMETFLFSCQRFQCTSM